MEAHGDVGGGGFGAGPERGAGVVVGLALCRMNWKVPVSMGFEGGDVDFSVALSGVAVADLEEAPLALTGMKSVVPATISLLSMFPACIQGGAELYLPAPPGGAMPMLPKKG